MNQELWMLVEWMDNLEQNLFSNYAIVNSDRVMRHDADLHTGSVIFLRDMHNIPRKAQILRLSENKRYVKELKIMLERQDNQVKNVLSLCVNTIKEMKTGPMFLDSNHGMTFPSGSQMLRGPHDSDSSDSNIEREMSHDLNLTRSTNRHDRLQRRTALTLDVQMSKILKGKSLFTKSRPPFSSTPLPDKMFGKISTMCDKATQTDEMLPCELRQLEEIEKLKQANLVLRKLYNQFVAFASENDDTQNRSLTERSSYSNEITEYVEPQVQSNEDNSVSSAVKIRRVSAQTTNNVMPADNSDLVSIGSGNVTIPAKVLEDIDWSSHTTATRQLLQAVFPRRVLATHSLTGKQSPAFVNKPPKKQLDPKLVEDIVDTVSDRCGVPQRVVRASITTKCTDEAKLYRNRQRFKKMREEQNQENVPPSSGSSESTNLGEDN